VCLIQLFFEQYNSKLWPVLAGSSQISYEGNNVCLYWVLQGGKMKECMRRDCFLSNTCYGLNLLTVLAFPNCHVQPLTQCSACGRQSAFGRSRSWRMLGFCLAEYCDFIQQGIRPVMERMHAPRLLFEVIHVSYFFVCYFIYKHHAWYVYHLYICLQYCISSSFVTCHKH
jgi:hypothetical protein